MKWSLFKKAIHFAIIGFAFSSCSDSNDNPDIPEPTPEPVPIISVGDDIEQFEIAFDSNPYNESESLPTSSADAFYGDYFENKKFSKVINVEFSDAKTVITEGGVTKEGPAKLILTPSASVEYVLSGKSSNGFFKLASNTFDIKITLNGLDLTNPDGAAINVQSKTRTYLHIADNTHNILADGNNYPVTSSEDMKGTVFTEGRLIVSGKGNLDINANCKNAIASDSYILFRPGHVINIINTASNGVKAKDAVYLNGGVLNIDVAANTSKGINSEGSITISGGRTTIISNGESEYNGIDLSNSAAIKCDLNYVQNGGIVYLQTNGKGAKAINCNQSITINGGEIYARVTGGKYVYNTALTSNSKGINADAAVTINDGTVKVIVSNIVSGEGIESKTNLYVKGGLVEVSSKDDCLKATQSVTIAGGKIYAYSHNADGIDCLGKVTVTGGVAVINGEVNNEGIDCDQNEFIVLGGTFVSVGSANSSVTSSAQKFFVYDKNVEAGTVLSLYDVSSSDSESYIIRFKLPRTYTPCSLLVSTPKMTSGTGVYAIKEVIVDNPDGIFHGLAY